MTKANAQQPERLRMSFGVIEITKKPRSETAGDLHRLSAVVSHGLRRNSLDSTRRMVFATGA